MIVEPDFVDHWKTELLVTLVAEAVQALLAKAQTEPSAYPNDNLSVTGRPSPVTGGLPLGDVRLNLTAIQPQAAPLWVLRLWAHCHNRKRGTFDNMSNADLRAVCKAPLPPDRWRDILVECKFIECNGSQVVVHDWEETNKGMVAKWRNGPLGGRPKKTDKEPNRNLKKTGEPSAETDQSIDQLQDQGTPVVPSGDILRAASADSKPTPEKKEKGGRTGGGVPGGESVVEDAIARLTAIWGRKRGGFGAEARKALWTWVEEGLLPAEASDWEALAAYYNPPPMPGDRDERNRRKTAETLAQNLGAELAAARLACPRARTPVSQKKEPGGWRAWFVGAYPKAATPGSFWDLPADLQAEFEGRGA